MALTHTPAPEFGSACPDFSLRGVDGKPYRLADFHNREILVVMFICNHCPYVQAVEDRLIGLARKMMPKGVGFVAICSNDAEIYPDDSFENLRARAEKKQYPFPYLHDETQSVAKDFGAVCTPDFFVYDNDRKLRYRGRLDDSWKEPSKVTSRDLEIAVETLLQGQLPSQNQHPSMGCSIKWLHEDL